MAVSEPVSYAQLRQACPVAIKTRMSPETSHAALRPLSLMLSVLFPRHALTVTDLAKKATGSVQGGPYLVSYIKTNPQHSLSAADASSAAPGLV